MSDYNKDGLPIGLYGCNCHPFPSISDWRKAVRKRFQVGDKVRVRHSGKEGIVTGRNVDAPQFYHIFFEPYKYVSDNGSEPAEQLELITSSSDGAQTTER
jgi:hypothetical protein